MYAHILEIIKQLLLSPAFKTQIDAYESEFRAGTVVNAQDRNGVVIPLNLNHPLVLEPFKRVETQEPPRIPGGPFPVAYVYHLKSDYPEKDQEFDFVQGIHQIGLSIFGSAKLPEEAEMVTGRLMAAAIQLIHDNQYIFGGIPRAAGASTVVFAKTVMPGMQLPKVVIPYHTIFVVRAKELRHG
jgi:hypothetical protein